MNTKNDIVDLAERRDAKRHIQEPVTYNLRVTHRPDEMTFSIFGLPNNLTMRTLVEDDLELVLKELRTHLK